MRSHFRKTLPEDVGERMTKAANSAATHMEGWAKDSYDSMKASPAIWGAASLGIGALAGGLYALWRNKDKLNGIHGLDSLWHRSGKTSRRTMAARSRPKQTRRAKVKMANMKMDGAAMESAPMPKRAKRTRRARPATHAEA